MTSRAIVRLREGRGLSQADLADRLGMKRAQLCRIERGGVAPTPPTIARIAKALGVNPEDLAEGDCRLEGALMPTRRAVARLKAARVDVAAREADLDAQEDRRGIVSKTTLPLIHAYLLQPHAGEILAASLRDSLRVGMAAFADLVWTLEFANVRVWGVDLPDGADSAGWWNPERETLTLAIDSAATPERQLYRLAYELGAACLFRSFGGHPIAETKKQHRFLAEFAADFLMPAATIADMVSKTGVTPKTWTFAQLLSFKAHFGVSAEAFALRLEELGLIDPELRVSFRTRLRARYKTHRKAMEPAPCLNVLKCGYKLDILSDEGEK